jgi:poly-gamma-glutamate capsule biosynthesis protein CapA/YwtB (metallophosphatase superfamily)
MKSFTCRLMLRASALCLLMVPVAAAFSSFCLAETDGPWPWTGKHDDNSVTLLLLGDFNVQKREDPASALIHVRETLNRADLVYANLEGLLVKSEGPDKDIPGKSGWQHLGPEAVQALKAGNIRVVGVANNVAYGPENIMKSLSVLDANGMAHAGGGANMDEAHQPAIVERKGLRFGFLQYTAKWYQEEKQIATTVSPGVARVLSRDGSTIEPSDLNRLVEDIRRLRPLVDIVIVSSHTRDGQNQTGRKLQPSGAKPTPPLDQDLFSKIPVDRRLTQTEPYQRELAHAAIDAGADLVFGHGCHMLQAVEIYRGKPIMHCLGNFQTDWIRVRNYRDGMVARVIVQGKEVRRVSLVPVTRDEAANDVIMLDPSRGEGAKLLQELRDLSPGVPLKIDGQEAVLIDQQ